MDLKIPYLVLDFQLIADSFSSFVFAAQITISSSLNVMVVEFLPCSTSEQRAVA